MASSAWTFAPDVFQQFQVFVLILVALLSLFISQSVECILIMDFIFSPHCPSHTQKVLPVPRLRASSQLRLFLIRQGSNNFYFTLDFGMSFSRFQALLSHQNDIKIEVLKWPVVISTFDCWNSGNFIPDWLKETFQTYPKLTFGGDPNAPPYVSLSSPKSPQSDPQYTWCPVRGLTPPGHLSCVTPNLHHSVLTDCPGSSLLSCRPRSSGQKGEAEPCGAMTLG